MPFRHIKLCYTTVSGCTPEHRVIKLPNGAFSRRLQNPTSVTLPEPLSDNLGYLLEQGAELKSFGTQLYESCSSNVSSEDFDSDYNEETN